MDNSKFGTIAILCSQYFAHISALAPLLSILTQLCNQKFYIYSRILPHILQNFPVKYMLLNLTHQFQPNQTEKIIYFGSIFISFFAAQDYMYLLEGCFSVYNFFLPSIHSLFIWSIRCRVALGVGLVPIPGNHRMMGRVHLGQVARATQRPAGQTTMHAQTHT